MIGWLGSLLRVGRKFFTPAATQDYPERRPPIPPRWRGRLVLTRDPDGLERCVACGLCAVACPTGCIDLARAVAEDGRTYPARFRINLARCIFCGYCEEACPTCAIQLTPDFELAEWHRGALLYDKPDLLIAGEGKQHGYRYWSVAGKAIAGKAHGQGAQDQPPADPWSLRP